MTTEAMYPALAAWCGAHLDALSVGFIALNAQGVVLEATPRAVELCGMAGASLAGRPLDALPLPMQVDALRDMPLDHLRHCPVDAEAGAAPVFRCSVARLAPSANGAAFVVVLEPLPDAAAADNVRLQLEKLASIDDLVVGVAHELNNPLTAMLGYAELLLHKAQDESTRKRLATIAEESQRCHRIVQNLLTFASRNRRAKAPVDVNRLLADTVSLCRYQMRVDQIAIHLDLAAQPARVPGDSDALQRVFLNLLSNALHALGEVEAGKRRLEVTTAAREGMLCLAFRDTGSGVEPDITHRVFDPFFTTRRLGEGMGLGLSVAFGIVQDHGGRIWLDTAARDATTFRIELPLP